MLFFALKILLYDVFSNKQAELVPTTALIDSYNRFDWLNDNNQRCALKNMHHSLFYRKKQCRFDQPHVSMNSLCVVVPFFHIIIR